MLSISNFKAVGSDGFSPIIIKQNINAISKQLEYIFNLSFSSGIFPKLLKSAIVTPIYKSGSVTEPGNYRPISILTIFPNVWKNYITIGYCHLLIDITFCMHINLALGKNILLVLL